MTGRALLLGYALLLIACGPPGEADGDGDPGRQGAGDPAVAARPDGAGGTDGPSGNGRRTGGGDGDASATARSSPDAPAVLFFGTSLTAGYGLEDPDAAFPARIREKLDSADLPYRVVSAGVPGETSAAGRRRIGWALREPEVVALVLELGANDGLRGLDPEAMEENLQAVVDSVRARHPDAAVVVAGMEAPPNLGSRYTDRFRAAFRNVAERNDAALVPFLLEGVAGDTALNQADGIHPTARGHEILAENVWTVLEPVLRDRRASGDSAGGSPAP